MPDSHSVHLHLDLVGGLAGDMFAAGVLDAAPQLETRLLDALEVAGLNRLVTVARVDHNDGVLAGSRVTVEPVISDNADNAVSTAALFAPSPDGAANNLRNPDVTDPHEHRSWSDVQNLLHAAHLDDAVRTRALDIFTRLAEAEAQVHGVAVADVGFHEVGAWDSIADIVMAAWLLEALEVGSASCSAIPTGRGRVKTAHGMLPVPAPATTLLLKGMPLVDDGIDGERVTPTGAAILAHLTPSFDADRTARVLQSTGAGFGSKQMSGISNTVRVMVYDTANDGGLQRETVGMISFEVDDQTAEDLATGIERIRSIDGVLDVNQSAIFGKKGRLATSVSALCRLSARDAVERACLTETTTLGTRWQTFERTILDRSEKTVTVNDRAVNVKTATRPDGSLTVKADMDDLADIGDHAARSAARRRAQEDYE